MVLYWLCLPWFTFFASELSMPISIHKGVQFGTELASWSQLQELLGCAQFWRALLQITCTSEGWGLAQPGWGLMCSYMGQQPGRQLFRMMLGFSKLRRCCCQAAAAQC